MTKIRHDVMLRLVKALECGLNDGRAWIVRSNKVLVDGKMRTVLRLVLSIMAY